MEALAILSSWRGLKKSNLGGSCHGSLSNSENKRKQCKTEGSILVRPHTVSVPYLGSILALPSYGQDTARVWHTYQVWPDQDNVFGFAVKIEVSFLRLEVFSRSQHFSPSNPWCMTSLAFLFGMNSSRRGRGEDWLVFISFFGMDSISRNI